MNIHLGFEIDTGKPVSIPLKHTAITGQTQEAGKTTTLEALISRSGLKAIVFITKRGEGAFQSAHRIPPYFRERADWVYVASLIDATLGEKNKILRAWLMKVCRNTRTLAEVQANVKTAKNAARGFSESIYTEIEGYLDLVVPQIAELPPAPGIYLRPGLNAIDLSPYSAALQALVIRSVLDYIYEHEKDVVTVIPEAWEFLPEGRNSPVKQAGETLIRKGASLRNYVWLDSQDMAGVWKLALRAAAVWLIGVQRESNEIKRTLANIPGNIARPKAGDIASLELGQFFVCYKSNVIKTYVQPIWLDEDQARAVALGSPIPEPPSNKNANRINDLEQKIDKLIELQFGTARGGTQLAPISPSVGIDEENLYQTFKRRLFSEIPSLFKITTEKPQIIIEVTRPTFEIDSKTLRGRLLVLISEGFFDEVTTGNAAFNELKRVGFSTAKPNVYRELDRLTTDGALTKETGGYLHVPDLKIIRKDK